MNVKHRIAQERLNEITGMIKFLRKEGIDVVIEDGYLITKIKDDAVEFISDEKLFDTNQDITLNIQEMKVKQYNSSWKHLLMINGTPICIFKSKNMIAEAVQYINGDDAAINDGHIKKVLDKFRKPSTGKITKRKKKQKDKAIKKFNEC